MASLRILVLVPAVFHAIFAGFTALVGAFANGGDIWQRLLLVLVHPLGAAGVLLVVFRPRLAAANIVAVVALLTANVIADLRLAQLIAAGAVRGDWELAVAFSVVPAIGIVYGLALLLTARAAGARNPDHPDGNLSDPENPTRPTDRVSPTACSGASRHAAPANRITSRPGAVSNE